VWFTVVGAGQVGRLDAAGEPTLHQLDPPDSGRWCSRPARRCALSPDATTGSVGSLPPVRCPSIGRAPPSRVRTGSPPAPTARCGSPRRTPVPSAVPLPVPGAFPAHLAAGPDDALLFAANAANAVGRVSAAGGVTRHQRPGEGSAPVGLPAGGDGALWFTEIGGGRIGRIATTGDVEEIALPDPAARPHAIAAAPGRCALGHRVGAGPGRPRRPCRSRRGVRARRHRHRAARPDRRRRRCRLGGAGVGAIAKVTPS